jgi:uncharacterized OB-fold protein
MEILDNTFDVMRAEIGERAFSAPFWEATRERRLLLQRCRQTGGLQFFPRPVSIFTGRAELDWEEVDGRGSVYSFTVTRLGLKQFKGHEPYAVIIARLDAGVDIVSLLVNATPAELRIGLRIKPFWHPLEDGRHLLFFAPDRPPSPSNA